MPEVPGGIKGLIYRVTGKAAQIEKQQAEQRRAAFEQRATSATRSIQETVAIDQNALSGLLTGHQKLSSDAMLTEIAESVDAFTYAGKFHGAIVNGKSLRGGPVSYEYHTEGDIDKVGNVLNANHLNPSVPRFILKVITGLHSGSAGPKDTNRPFSSLTHDTTTFITLVNLKDNNTALMYSFPVLTGHVDYRSQTTIGAAIFRLPKTEAYKLYLLMKTNPANVEKFFQKAASGLDQPQDSKQPGIQRVKGPTYFVRLDKFDPNIFNPYRGTYFESEQGLPSGNVALDAQKIFAESFQNPSSGKFEPISNAH